MVISKFNVGDIVTPNQIYSGPSLTKGQHYKISKVSSTPSRDYVYLDTTSSSFPTPLEWKVGSNLADYKFDLVQRANHDNQTVKVYPLTPNESFSKPKKEITETVIKTMLAEAICYWSDEESIDSQATADAVERLYNKHLKK